MAAQFGAEYVKALERQLAEKDEALREAHEYLCGCDQPGSLDFCGAPEYLREALRAEPAKDPAADERIVLPNETALFSQIAESVYEDEPSDT